MILSIGLADLWTREDKLPKIIYRYLITLPFYGQQCPRSLYPYYINLLFLADYA